MNQLRLLEPGPERVRALPEAQPPATYEPPPARPNRFAALLAVLIVLCLVGQMVGMLLLQQR